MQVVGYVVGNWTNELIICHLDNANSLLLHLQYTELHPV